MVSVLTGLVGGFVGTLVMTVVRKAVVSDAGPPPTADLWAKYVGGGAPTDYKQQGMVLHFLYGTVAGGVFVPIFTAVSLGLAVTTLVGGLVWGVVYGFVLFAIGAVGWLKGVLGKSPDKSAAKVFLLGHVVYGATLGLWVWLGVP